MAEETAQSTYGYWMKWQTLCKRNLHYRQQFVVFLFKFYWRLFLGSTRLKVAIDSSNISLCKIFTVSEASETFRIQED